MTTGHRIITYLQYTVEQVSGSLSIREGCAGVNQRTGLILPSVPHCVTLLSRVPNFGGHEKEAIHQTVIDAEPAGCRWYIE
jgi:hypothetical protein